MRLAVLQSYSDQNAGPLLLFEGGKMSNSNEQDNELERQPSNPTENTDQKSQKDLNHQRDEKPLYGRQPESPNERNERSDESPSSQHETSSIAEGRPVERSKGTGRPGARGTAAMDPKTRQEVARKGGLAVSRNKQHMAEIGRKGGQSVSKNREHMALIGRKGGAASRGHR